MNVCSFCNNINPLDATTCLRCARDLPAATPSSPAATLEQRSFAEGRYQVETTLGVGGMGHVVRAQDTRLNRVVALKVLHRNLVSHPTARKRMTREAQALARVRSDNVVQVIDVFDEGDDLILVLEYIAGGDLVDRLVKGPLAVAEATRMMEGILSGLQAIHQVGLVHRDVKPANVLITLEGTPRITDLGVAHDADGSGMTSHGAVLGTPNYMSPEQVLSQEVDPRSDVYGAGVLLYELLSGLTPFDDDSDFEIRKGHVERVPDLGPVAEVAPAHVVEVVRRALAKDPNARWQSARAMADALRQPGSLPVTTGIEGDEPDPHLEPQKPGSFAPVAMAAGVLLAVGAVAAFALLPGDESRRERDEPATKVQQPGAQSEATPNPEARAKEAPPQAEAPPEPADTEAGPMAPVLSDSKLERAVSWFGNPIKAMCPKIRRRLAGRFKLEDPQDSAALAEAVARYQSENGMKPDGRPGSGTLRALFGTDARNEDCPECVRNIERETYKRLDPAGGVLGRFEPGYRGEIKVLKNDRWIVRVHDQIGECDGAAIYHCANGCCQYQGVWESPECCRGCGE